MVNDLSIPDVTLKEFVPECCRWSNPPTPSYTVPWRSRATNPQAGFVGVWGRVLANMYLLDMVNRSMDFVAKIAAIMELSNKWPPTANAKYVEDKANGPAMIRLSTVQWQRYRAVGYVSPGIERGTGGTTYKAALIGQATMNTGGK